VAGPRWDTSHNPNTRPLGCNGRYGHSGADWHYRRKQKVCARCKRSRAHYERERRRGGLVPARLKPCGTTAAAQRHRDRGEDVCFKCKVADADKAQRRRDAARGVGVPTP
jgi:hypothetical protein